METDHTPSAVAAAHARSGKRQAALLAGALLACITLPGCTLPGREHYRETYEITHLTVVLMDEESLQRKWRDVSGKPASRHVSIPIGPDELLTYDKTVRGFFDFTTNTIYCPRMNFDVCGHELFHAIIGRFHPEN